MPRIAEIKEIDGAVWVRADIPNLENGSAWWSPAEQEANYREGYRDGKLDARQWEPIETAPRDGRQILAYGDVRHEPCLIFFCDGAWHYDTAGNSEFHNPTVWLPLPAPPVLDGEV